MPNKSNFKMRNPDLVAYQVTDAFDIDEIRSISGMYVVSERGELAYRHYLSHDWTMDLSMTFTIGDWIIANHNTTPWDVRIVSDKTFWCEYADRCDE